MAGAHPGREPGDITLRALEVLRAADAVACEDTRRTGALLTHLGIRKPLVRLDAHTMAARRRCSNGTRGWRT